LTEAVPLSQIRPLMSTVTFDTKSEIAELEQHLLELQHHLLELKQYILRWSKQDIEKSHKDSAEERHILYSSARSIIDAKQKRVNLLRALVYA
jgi:hypothetical protein